MVLPARVSSLLIVSLVALAALGCGKKEEEPVVMALPSATVAPVKAVEDSPQPPPATGNATADAVPVMAASTAPVAEPPKVVAQQPIDGCCSALAAMLKDPKTAAGVKAKATAAGAMCGALAKQVREGKGSRTTALTQIKATMAGSAPSQCN